jgi:hypothetical protein
MAQEGDMQLTPGARFRSAVCDTEIVIVRPPRDATAVLACGGESMLPYDSVPAGKRPMAAGQDGGAVLGKRYGLADDPVEVLVTKPGVGGLSLAGRPLAVKDRKPLPSSD